MNAIGANYENALAALEIPGTEFYVPQSTDTMNCETIEANIRLLNTFITTWQSRLRDAERQLIRSRETISNCQKIILALSVKLGSYEAKRTSCAIQVQPPGNESSTPAPIPTEKNSSNLLYWLAGAGVAVYLYKKHKRKKA